MISIINNNTTYNYSHYASRPKWLIWMNSRQVNKQDQHEKKRPLFRQRLSLFQAGELLCWSSDLSFLNLRAYFSNLLKALHICRFAARNNKKILFVNGGYCIDGSTALLNQWLNESYLRQVTPRTLSNIFKTSSKKRSIRIPAFGHYQGGATSAQDLTENKNASVDNNQNLSASSAIKANTTRNCFIHNSCEGKSKGSCEGKSKGSCEGKSKGSCEGKSKGSCEGKSKGKKFQNFLNFGATSSKSEALFQGSQKSSWPYAARLAIFKPKKKKLPLEYFKVYASYADLQGLATGLGRTKKQARQSTLNQPAQVTKTLLPEFLLPSEVGGYSRPTKKKTSLVLAQSVEPSSTEYNSGRDLKPFWGIKKTHANSVIKINVTEARLISQQSAQGILAPRGGFFTNPKTSFLAMQNALNIRLFSRQDQLSLEKTSKVGRAILEPFSSAVCSSVVEPEEDRTFELQGKSGKQHPLVELTTSSRIKEDLLHNKILVTGPLAFARAKANTVDTAGLNKWAQRGYNQHYLGFSLNTTSIKQYEQSRAKTAHKQYGFFGNPLAWQFGYQNLKSLYYTSNRNNVTSQSPVIPIGLLRPLAGKNAIRLSKSKVSFYSPIKQVLGSERSILPRNVQAKYKVENTAAYKKNDLKHPSASETLKASKRIKKTPWPFRNYQEKSGTFATKQNDQNSAEKYLHRAITKRLRHAPCAAKVAANLCRQLGSFAGFKKGLGGKESSSPVRLFVSQTKESKGAVIRGFLFEPNLRYRSHYNAVITLNQYKQYGMLTKTAFLGNRLADVIVFLNPEKNQNLVNQANSLKIPTIGVISGDLSIKQKKRQSSRNYSLIDSVYYPIIGNPASPFFIRTFIGLFARML
jgi:hypothetical protein